MGNPFRVAFGQDVSELAKNTKAENAHVAVASDLTIYAPADGQTLPFPPSPTVDDYLAAHLSLYARTRMRRRPMSSPLPLLLVTE